MKTFSEEELTALLQEQADWRFEQGKLVRDLEFSDFAGAMQFVNRVAEIAEEANHHPDIDIRYNRVRLGLVSHDVGGITKRDAALATRLSGLL